MSERLRTIPTTDLAQGMVSPQMPFVQLDGTLHAVSFRFLFRLWNAVSGTALLPRTVEADAQRIEALEARVAALEARLP